jgi:hypothetical protein
VSDTRTIRVLPQTRVIRIIEPNGTRVVKVRSRVLRIVEVGRVVINNQGISDNDLPDFTLIFNNQLI